MIVEDGVTLQVEEKDIASKDMDVFYNPVMAYQRDLTISFLKTYFNKPIKVALPLAGSGIRGIRILKHIAVEHLYMNDRSDEAVKLIKKHLTLNNVNKKKVSVFSKDANEFISESVYDFVDIDPYGSSIYFIASAIPRIANNGVLAVTNTDTAALAGTYPSVTKRRYGAKPSNTESRQEVGIRILVRKCQEIAAMYDVGLIPVLSMAKDHYSRVFFVVKRGKKHANYAVQEHSFVKRGEFGGFSLSNNSEDIGPLYTGSLQDKKFIDSLDMQDKTIEKLQNDATLDSLFYFYDIHDICQTLKRDVPSYEKLFTVVKKKGYTILRTHFYKTAIKTNCPEKELIKIIKKL